MSEGAAVSLFGPQRSDGPAAVTVGVFDGVHQGHRALLRELHAAARSRGARAVVVTFEPNPRCVLDPERCPARLTEPGERDALLRAAGADEVVPLRFTRELSQVTAAAFCDALTSELRATVLVEGPGFALGHRRQGDLAFLRGYGAAHGFDVVEVPVASRDGDRVSATRIRTALAAGRVGEAARLLGRPYHVPGIVVHGNHTGRTLGYPTANLAPPDGRCIPALGIYAGWLDWGEGWRPSAISVGVRPTFGAGNPVLVEAYVLDFDGDLYGRQTRLAFTQRLRGDRRFASVAALVTRMGRDVERVREVLHDAPPA